MKLPNGDFDLDFSKIHKEDRGGILKNQEINSTFLDPGMEWYSINDPKTSERYFYTLGFSSNGQFLFVLLTVNKNDFNRLVVERVIIAKDESQIRKHYYKPKFE